MLRLLWSIFALSFHDFVLKCQLKCEPQGPARPGVSSVGRRRTFPSTHCAHDSMHEFPSEDVCGAGLQG